MNGRRGASERPSRILLEGRESKSLLDLQKYIRSNVEVLKMQEEMLKTVDD